MKMSGGRDDGRSSAAVTSAKSAAASSTRSRSITRPSSFAAPGRCGRPRSRCRSPASRRRSGAGPRSDRRAAGDAARRSAGPSARRGQPRRAVVGSGSGHSRAGQTSVIGSTAEISWLRPNSVNRLRGWSVEVGSSPASGVSPVSCAGTASDVLSATVVALRYRVASAAKRARLGNSSASIRPSARVSVEIGSSSRTMWTIGVDDRSGPATDPDASPGINEIGDGREHEEPDQEHERSGGEDGQERADAGRAHVEVRRAGPDQQRDADRRRRARQRVAERAAARTRPRAAR